ncbi:MAG: OFA family MFS transporter [Nocardiopsaceae bacterium]|nr:OFA family MFS transporter [Nocardiopsaceae bacterium]
MFRVGEDPKDILGRSRGYMIWLPWLAMMAAGIFEYAYGSAVDTLQSAYGWSDTSTFALAGVWGFFQAGVALPAGRLREKNILPARTAMLTGAVFCLIAFVTVGNTSNIVINIFGYSVLGGIGAGLVYATCINITGKWYPEKKGGPVGFMDGGFAYGSVPFIFIFSYWFSVGDHRLVLTGVGIFMLVLMGGCGWFFKDPPRNWWPAEIDPETWVKNRATGKNVSKNPPAAKQFSWSEAMRTWQIYVLWAALVMTSGVSFFGISFESSYAKEAGFAVYVAALSAALLAFVNGTGRGFTGWLSDRLGRKETLILICVVLGLAQFGVGWAGATRNEALFFVFAIISGFGGGAFYPMFAIITPDYFGENYNASTYGTVYSGKVIGAVLTPFGAAFVDAFGYSATYILAGSIGLVSALLVLTLRQPKGDRGVDGPGRIVEAAAEVPTQVPSADSQAGPASMTEE